MNLVPFQHLNAQDIEAALNPWGWNGFFAAAFADYDPQNQQPARVIAEYQGLYRLVLAGGETLAEISGKLRHQSSSREELPAVGDWVVCTWTPAMQHARIDAVLPRRSQFMRKQTGGRSEGQIVASNVDTLLLVSALNHDLNLRRIERYLSLAWDSGAKPLIILSKADLSEDPESLRQEVENIAMGTDIVVLSSLSGQGLDDLKSWLKPGQTLALMGSSGVGKSTLINTLAGQNLQEVKEIRSDDSKGRHTTTHRQLFKLADGPLMLDTPGMRELQLWQTGGGVEASFADVSEQAAEIALRCRYRNCHHQPDAAGCAINEALASGELDPGRWQNYLKLQREEAWAERRQDAALTSQVRKHWKQIHQYQREHYRHKYGQD